MGLRLNHISASNGNSGAGALLDGQGGHAIGLSGSMYFQPGRSGQTLGAAAAANPSGATGGPGFLGNPDAAYIFSGSVGGNDKALFLGDVVVSGSLSLGDGSEFVDTDGTGTLHEIAIFKDGNTLKGDAKLVYNSSADELIYGGAVLDIDTTGAIELDADAASNLTTSAGALTLDGAAGVNIAGNSSEVDITTSGAVDINGAAITVDASSGLSLDAAGASNFTLSDGDLSLIADGSDNKVLIKGDHESDVAVHIDGNAATASIVDIDAGVLDVDAAGAITMDAGAASNFSASAGDLTFDSAAGSINLLGGEADAAAVRIQADNAAGGIDVDAGTGGIAIDTTGVLSLSGSGNSDLQIGGTLDIDARNAITIDSNKAGISIDGAAASNFTTSAGALTLKGAAGETVGTSGQTTALAGDLTVAENATITGTLTVNGTTTTVNSTTVTVDDPIITLGGDSAPGSDDNKDRGVEFRYHDGSSARIGFMGWDDSAEGFTILSAASNSSEVFSGTAAPLVMGGLTSTSVIVSDGGTIGSVSDTDAIAISSGGDVTFSQDILMANQKTIGSAGTSDLLTLNANDLTVKAAKSIKVDEIVETTTDGGVTVEGVKIVAGSSQTTMGVSSDADAITFVNSSGLVGFTNTTDASNATTAAVGFSGGVGIAKKLYVGTDLEVGDDLTLGSASALLSIGGSGQNVDFQHIPGSVNVTFTSALTDSSTRLSGFGASSMSSPSAFTSATTTLQYSSGIPAALQEGEYIIFRNSSNASVAFRVTASASNGATAVSVEYVVGSYSGASSYTSSGGNADVSGAGASTSGFSSVFKDDGGGTPPAVSSRVLKALRVNEASQLQFRASANTIHSSASGLLDIEAQTKILLGVGGEVLSVDSNSVNLSQALLPSSDNAIDLGSSAARFANIYTGDLNLRNDRGDWTLIEEEDFISFRNNATGRRFRMVMEDITGLGTYGPGNDGEM